LTRLRELLNLINSVLGVFNPLIRVIEHYIDARGNIEYINVSVLIPHHNITFLLPFVLCCLYLYVSRVERSIVRSLSVLEERVGVLEELRRRVVG